MELRRESERLYNVRKIIEQADLNDPRQRAECDNILHRNWTKAVGTPHYDKNEWAKLLHLLEGQ